MIWSTFTSILGIFGALGIFLFGMKVMSEGIQKVAGDSMRHALATMTKNRLSATFTGFFTTCLVQSSSATTVLVVSFVNAGLLTLVESIGIIMGANLGTTITAWLVAFLPKFNIADIALPTIGIGLPLFFAGKDKLRALGESLIGFGLLFFGLDELKNAVPDIKSMMVNDPGMAASINNVIDTIQGFGVASTLLFLGAGILLTVVVQSSSAAMAITIACAWNGWFGDDPYQAFMSCAAIVLGENIGTTITAWLASLGANVHAKRAARAHFMFNVIGTVWALIFFGLFTKLVWSSLDLFPQWMVDMKTKDGGSEAGSQLMIVAFAMAIFHSTFNFLNICLLLPFIHQIAALVEKMVKHKEGTQDEASRIRYISQNLVDLGELNIVEAEQAVAGLSDHCIKMFRGFIEVFEHPTEDMSEKVSSIKKMEDEADMMMHDITEYLVRCSSKELSSTMSERITGLLRITAELEECSDAIYRLIKIAERQYNKNRSFGNEHTDTLRELTANVEAFMLSIDRQLLKEVKASDIELAEQARARITTQRKSLNKQAMQRMTEGQVKLEMLYIDTNNQLDVISNHILHIAHTNAEIS